MSAVTLSLKSLNFTDWNTDATHIPSSYENATFIDYVDNHETTISHENNDPLANVESMSTPVWLIILMISISTWIIIANGLILWCLVTSRDTLKNNVNVQLLSLSLTDMLVGISVIPGVLLPMTTQFSRYESCAILIYMYNVTQAATLCHTLLICVNRLLTIKRKSYINASTNESLKTIFIQIATVWIGCIVFYSIHFSVFSRFGKPVNQCTLLQLFEGNYLVAIGTLTIPLLVPTQLCTNIIYVHLFIYIRQRLRVVGIVQVQPKHSPDRFRLKRYRTQDKPLPSVNNLGDVHTSQREQIPSTSKETDRRMGYAQTKVQSLSEQEVGTSTAYKSKRKGNNYPGRNFPETPLTTMERGGNETLQIRTNNSRLGLLERQKRVLVTFGILLISLNIFMTPLDFLGIIELLRNEPLSRRGNVVSSSVIMAMLNSALNPAINLWRIKQFRLIMKEKAMSIYELLRFR